MERLARIARDEELRAATPRSPASARVADVRALEAAREAEVGGARPGPPGGGRSCSLRGGTSARASPAARARRPGSAAACGVACGSGAAEEALRRPALELAVAIELPSSRPGSSGAELWQVMHCARPGYVQRWGGAAGAGYVLLLVRRRGAASVSVVPFVGVAGPARVGVANEETGLDALTPTLNSFTSTVPTGGSKSPSVASEIFAVRRQAHPARLLRAVAPERRDHVVRGASRWGPSGWSLRSSPSAELHRQAVARETRWTRRWILPLP